MYKSSITLAFSISKKKKNGHILWKQPVCHAKNWSLKDIFIFEAVRHFRKVRLCLSYYSMQATLSISIKISNQEFFAKSYEKLALTANFHSDKR